MAIQCRHGKYSDFNPDKLVTAEWATVTSGDPNTKDGKASYHCFSPGDVKRMATYDDMKADIDNATADVQKAFSEGMTEATNAANEAAKIATEAKEAAETATSEASAAAQAANEAAEKAEAAVLGDVSDKTVTFETAGVVENIESGESLAILFGKIRKVLLEVRDGAFSEVSEDLTVDSPGFVLDARAGKKLNELIQSTIDDIDTINTNLSKKMDAIPKFSPKGIWCGTFTKSNYAGGTSVQLQNSDGTSLTRATLNNWFGVNYSAEVAKAHYVAFAMNGDAATTGIHISGVAWNNDSLYAVAEDSLSGKTFRINWCVIWF